MREPSPMPYDVIVVGGRLAGAGTALQLARSGRRVLVVDRARYGSDLLSTHALMRAGVMQLSRWGLLDEVRAAGTPAIRRTVVRYGDVEEVVDIRPTPEAPALYAPRRSVLDRILVDAAWGAGAEFRFQTRVTGLLRDEAGRVVGVVGRDRDGRFEARAPLTIGADGPRSTVARLVDAPVRSRGRNATAFVAHWWEGLEADGYQWLYGDGVSGGVIPTNDGKACVWVGVPWTSFPLLRAQADLGFRATFERLAPDWAGRLDGGRPEGPARGFPGLPGFLRQAAGPGWALVGDAGYFKDPISTHGMTDALRDAELLARAIMSADGRDPGRALRDYERTRDRLSLPLFRLADQVAAYDWDLAELRELLVAMSSAMRAEVAHLSALDVAEAVA